MSELAAARSRWRFHSVPDQCCAPRREDTCGLEGDTSTSGEVEAVGSAALLFLLVSFPQKAAAVNSEQAICPEAPGNSLASKAGVVQGESHGPEKGARCSVQPRHLRLRLPPPRPAHARAH